MSTRLIQLRKGADRAVALVDEPHLHLLAVAESIYTLASESLEQRRRLSSLAAEKATESAFRHRMVSQLAKRDYIASRASH